MDRHAPTAADKAARTYVLLMPGSGCEPPAAEIEAAFAADGWTRWDGNGDPTAAVVHNRGPKGDFFEAGFYAGRGVPLFFLGGGSRCHSRKQLVGRLGGWTVVGANDRCTAAELIAAVRRRFPAAAPADFEARLLEIREASR